MSGSRSFLLLTAVLAAGGCGRGPEASPAPTPTGIAAIVPAESASAETFRPLAGRWHRTDGDYTLEILNVAADGRVEMRYLNPGPINVAAARASREGADLRLVIELRDRGYPGNLYTLTFQPSKDVLRGLYSHLGIGQTFDVTFVREPAP